MPWWLLLLLVASIKVPIAVLMVWIPLRSDEAMNAPHDARQDGGSEDDGGSKTLPGDPRGPHPRHPLPMGPRRGPHGTPSSPPRVRRGRRVIARPPAAGRH